MSFGLAFWILMILWALFGLGVFTGYVAGATMLWGGGLLLFVLLALLGWKLFGPPLRP